jgi:hypothetical protein
MNDQHVPTPVIGILGSGRSGSTLLEYLLSCHLEGSRALGELETLVLRGLSYNELCTCRQPSTECDQWSAIFTELAAHPGRYHWEQVIRQGWRRIAWGLSLCGGELGRRLVRNGMVTHPPAVCAYRAVLAVLAAISPCCDCMIDNSKTPLHFFALASTGAVDLRVVHLVRQPQAVVWSWTRRKPLPESGQRLWFMDPKPPWRAICNWLFDVFMAALFRRLHPAVPFVRLGYDELCSDPPGTINRCCRELALQSKPLPERPASYHAIGGNPDRFDGFRRMTPDEEWRHGTLPFPTAVVVRLVAAPVYRLLLRGRLTAR